MFFSFYMIRVFLYLLSVENCVVVYAEEKTFFSLNSKGNYLKATLTSLFFLTRECYFLGIIPRVLTLPRVV